jgi:lysophospholipase L1-like esterase
VDGGEGPAVENECGGICRAVPIGRDPTIGELLAVLVDSSTTEAARPPDRDDYRSGHAPEVDRACCLPRIRLDNGAKPDITPSATTAWRIGARMASRRSLILSATLIALALPEFAAAKSTPLKQSGSPRYYLALGDSLSQGMQPNVRGITLPTGEGYVDDLFALERKRIGNLTLVKLGCGGENTTSMVTGRGNKFAHFYHCHPAGGSQLAAAVRFLKRYHQPGEVPLVTIDIGANDIDNCTAPGVDLVTCLIAGEASIKRNVPKILAALRRAAPSGTTFVGMTLYDPVLGDYFNPGQRALALFSPALAKTVNQELIDADHGAKFRTADVANAFLTYDTTRMVTWEGQSIPIDVARVCAWTWACSTPPSGPNIHANNNGYTIMARAFSAVIGRLH